MFSSFIEEVLCKLVCSQLLFLLVFCCHSIGASYTVFLHGIFFYRVFLHGRQKCENRNFESEAQTLPATALWAEVLFHEGVLTTFNLQGVIKGVKLYEIDLKSSIYSRKLKGVKFKKKVTTLAMPTAHYR